MTAPEDTLYQRMLRARMVEEARREWQAEDAAKARITYALTALFFVTCTVVAWLLMAGVAQ